MKKLFIIFFMLWGSIMHAQEVELPTIATEGFSFSIGTKFTIKLEPVDSVNFHYSIIEFESFQEILDTYKGKEDLFGKEGEDNTISFYFTFATNGDTEGEREKNMKVVLILKNYSKHHLTYLSEILLSNDFEHGEYKETSNVGTYAGVVTTEIWPHMIYSIGLRNFKLRDL